VLQLGGQPEGEPGFRSNFWILSSVGLRI